ncbi:MAG: S41 family peptidase [Candidatus Eisenbacteria bacterium]|nr:S41 family peptidase [Candidatus Eisenbacteria bacterium]
MKQRGFLLLLCVLVAASSPVRSRAQIRINPGDTAFPVDARTRAAVIDSVCAALERIYVFPDAAEKMAGALRENLRLGKYEGVDRLFDFTQAVTRDLQEAHRDPHLAVFYSPPGQVLLFGAEETDEEREAQREKLARENYWFRKAEILAGNVGYLRFDGFADAVFSGPTAAAAMGFLAGCDALVIDLRWNGGGSPSLIQFIMGYLMEEPTHLNTFYRRRENDYQQFWSAPWVPGPSMAGTDLYVLVGERTGSAAEEFAYNVQALERGTLVGGVTWGGAHPVETVVWPDLRVVCNVPYGRAINPITGSNWEGTGVQPDEMVDPGRDALDVAYRMALRGIRERTEDPAPAARLDWVIAGLDAELEGTAPDPARFAGYAGLYGERKITFDGNDLWYQRGEMPRRRLLPLTDTLFGLEGVEFFRLELVLEPTTGRPTKLIGRYEDGRTDESARTVEP